MNKYFLSMNTQKANHAGSKAVLDCENILEQAGYKRKLFFYQPSKNKFINRINKLFQLISIAMTPKESIILCAHPLYIHSNYFKFFEWMHRHKKSKICFLVHDLETLRHMLPDWEVYANNDEKMFKMADRIIVHNDSMMRFLLEERNISPERLINLKLFDYLVADEKKEEFAKESGNGVIVAGNLAPNKSGYVYSLADEMDEKEPLELYGVNFEKDKVQGENWEYVGSFDADELPFIMKGHYGLVWDGTSIECCDGPTGNYVRYNNPHKVSLYIASGLPVIIWKQAALSSFIEENNVGIAVESLKDLKSTLECISEEKYQQMRENARKMAVKVRNGGYLFEAISKMEESFK